MQKAAHESGHEHAKTNLLSTFSLAKNQKIYKVILLFGKCPYDNKKRIARFVVPAIVLFVI
jgi:hypothetical protein